MWRYHLIELRKKRGLSKRELAARLEISIDFINKLEYGSANPGRKTSLKFEKFYQESERTLFPDLFDGKNFTKNEQVTQYE